MKKKLAAIMAAVLILSFSVMNVSAHGGGHHAGGHHGGAYANPNCAHNTAACHYVDADHDGICDTCNNTVCVNACGRISGF